VRNLLDTIVRKIKTHVSLSIHFPSKIVLFVNNARKPVTGGQATVGNTTPYRKDAIFKPSN
jgi:hypothetical protein